MESVKKRQPAWISGERWLSKCVFGSIIYSKRHAKEIFPRTIREIHALANCLLISYSQIYKRGSSSFCLDYSGNLRTVCSTAQAPTGSRPFDIMQKSAAKKRQNSSFLQICSSLFNYNIFLPLARPPTKKKPQGLPKSSSSRVWYIPYK